MNDELYILDITDEDLIVVERWLIKVQILEVEDLDEDDEVYVSRKIIFEIIEKYSPTVDIALELGYEVSKLPIYVRKKDTNVFMNRYFKEE